MRPGVIIAIVIAIAVLIGGVVYFNNQNSRVALEQERNERPAQIVIEEENERLQREEDNRAAQDVIVPNVEDRTQQDEATRLDAEPATRADDTAQSAEPATGSDVVTDDTAPSTEQAPILVGDEITDDTIVVVSPFDTPVIMNPENVTVTAKNVDEAASTTSSAETDIQTGDNGIGSSNDIGQTNAPSDQAQNNDATAEAEKLLTPETFDRKQVLALIDTSDELSSEQRSTLRSLVEGTESNLGMMTVTLNSIRSAFDLPPLN